MLAICDPRWVSSEGSDWGCKPSHSLAPNWTNTTTQTNSSKYHFQCTTSTMLFKMEGVHPACRFCPVLLHLWMLLVVLEPFLFCTCQKTTTTTKPYSCSLRLIEQHLPFNSTEKELVRDLVASLAALHLSSSTSSWDKNDLGSCAVVQHTHWTVPLFYSNLHWIGVDWQKQNTGCMLHHIQKPL